MPEMMAMSWGHGLTIVVVGGYMADRPYIAEAGRRAGLRMIAALSDAIEENLADQSWYRVVRWHADCKHEEYMGAAQALVLALRDEKVDGVVAFSDYCVPLAGMLAELLGVARCPAERLWSCKSKYGAYSILLAAGSPYPPKVCRLDERADLPTCAQTVGLPAVLRVSHGNSAIGTRLVYDLAELSVEAERMRALPDSPNFFSAEGFQNDILLVEYLQGSEHDIDIVIVDGQPRFWFVTDNGPTDLPFFRETSHLFPSRLPAATQAQLLEGAVACLCELGLRNGVYNVEMRFTASGPRLIEINLRMGGFYIHDFTKLIWGYDLCEAALAVACGREPKAALADDRRYLAGFMCYPSHPVDLGSIPADAMNIDCKNSASAEYEEPSYMLSFPGATPEEAVQYAMAAAPSIVGLARGVKLQNYLRTFLTP